MNETQFKTKVLKYLKTTYPNAYILKLSDRFISGVLDVYMLNNGCSYWIELKVKPNKPTHLQTFTIKKIHEAGGKAIVAYTLEDIKEMMINGL